MHPRVLCKSHGQGVTGESHFLEYRRVGKHFLTIVVFWEHRLQAKFNTVGSLVLDDGDGGDD